MGKGRLINPMGIHYLVVVNPIDEKVHSAVVSRVPVVAELAHDDRQQAEYHGDCEDERDHRNDEIPATIPHPRIIVVVEILPRELCNGFLHVEAVAVEDGRPGGWDGLQGGHMDYTWIIV